MAKTKPAKTAETASVPTITLADIVAATKGDAGHLYTPVEVHKPLVASGDVEVNPEMANEQGWLATRATEQAMNANQNQTAQSQPETAKPKFEIESNIVVPERKRNSSGLRAGRTPIYPFDALEIGQSFFVPDADGKSAHKSMASTLSGVNLRYSEEIAGQTRVNRKGVTVPATKQTRKYVSFDTERTIDEKLATQTGLAVGTVQKGARIFRVALDA